MSQIHLLNNFVDMIIRDACTHPWFVMKETWSRAETFSVPMKRVPEMT